MWNIGMKLIFENLVEQSLQILRHSTNKTVVYKNNSLFAKFSFYGKGLAVNNSTIAEGVTNSIASHQGGTVGASFGLVNTLRPVANKLVQSLLRKVPSPLWSEAKRRATKRLVFGETVPLFSLVGVTLVSGPENGILTKSDEVEALCGNIRDAISRVGWLHDPEYWENHSYEGKEEPVSTELLEEKHVFSLKDFELGNVIDKGCNAVVYAAKWKDDPKDIIEENKDTTVSRDPSQESLDSLDIFSSGSTVNEEVYRRFEEDDDEYFTASDTDVHLQPPAMERSSSDYLTIPNLLASKHQTRTQSLSEDIFKLVSEGILLSPRDHRKIKFKPRPPPDIDSSSSEDKSSSSRRLLQRKVPEEVLREETCNKCDYPLAMKMMFNYEAESNAPAIISAMYKELIPARNLQLDETLTFLKERFLGNGTILTSHVNIVEMPCVFVDRVPSLKHSMELFPEALPSRLNPDGYGRNMSLFCVMKRYDMSLSEYLYNYSPSNHTSLLLLTQLLEAVLHINEHNIAHRDMKADNILLSLTEGWDYPLLVLSDFGCCIADQSAGLNIPFPSYEADPRQGNAALMAPEVKTATPGIIKKVNYSKSDLWAAGTLAFELFGHENPFMASSKKENRKAHLDSRNFKDHQIPKLSSDVPGSIRRLIYAILRRNPKHRPTPKVAATLCQLMLWAPRKWLNRHSLTLPTHQEISQWLLCLTTKVLCEAKMSPAQNNGKSSVLLEYQLVSTLLSRVRYYDIIKTIKWNRSF